MKKTIYFILLIFWLIVIYLLSNQTGEVSETNSGTLIHIVLDGIYSFFHLSKNNLNDVVNMIHEPIRECAHFFEYFVLAFLSYKNLENWDYQENKTIIAFLFCFICAMTDEIHQLFIVGRAFQYYDILMDMMGCTLMLLFLQIRLVKVGTKN